MKGGGTLICSGPFGLFDEYGRPTGDLLKEALGNVHFTYDAQAGRWKAETGEQVLSGTVGAGRVVVFVNPVASDGQWEPFLAALQQAVPIQPVSTELDNVELILRSTPNGTLYLCALNLSIQESREGLAHVAGRFEEVVELTVEGGARVPVQYAAELTSVPLLLAPGECAVFRLGRPSVGPG